MSDNETLSAFATQVRRDILRMVHQNNSGHPGGALGATDFLTVLYNEFMTYDATNFTMNGKNEDLFFLSNGHLSALWYSILAREGYFPISELKSFRSLNSRLQGHPTTAEGLPGVRIASGSLGQGLSTAIGASVTKKLNNDDKLVYVLMGDGELQEGNIWEAAMACAHFKADNLCAIVDYNRFQIDGRTEQIMNLEPFANKWESFGWHVIQCDGHNIEELLESFNEAKSVKLKPTVIIAHTVKGKGVSFMEHVVDFHGRAPSEEEREIALKELNEIDRINNTEE